MENCTLFQERPPAGGYGSYVKTSFHHKALLMLRRKQIVLAFVISLAPVLVPLSIAFFARSEFAQNGTRIFVFLVENVYLKAVAPLLALHFGCILVGEDVESNMISYLLTRPLPRSSFVLGRVAAYILIVSIILILSMGTALAACTALGALSLSRETTVLFTRYCAVGTLSVTSYGMLCTFLGALTRRPLIFGVLLMFGWQPLAIVIPGAVDFLTFEKYLMELLPKLATERASIVVRTALMEYEKEQILVGTGKALAILLACNVVLVGLTCIAVKYREYSQARALGG